MDIAIIRGDITERRVDAIVNGANTWLIPGGGIDGSIHRAGGPTILDECRRIIREQHSRGLIAGQAVATTGGDLPAKWVIHTVAPIFSKTVDRSEQLIAAYRSALRVADGVGAITVAFPALSTGVYGFPVKHVAALAIEALVYALPTANVVRAEFVFLEQEHYDAFCEAAED